MKLPMLAAAAAVVIAVPAAAGTVTIGTGTGSNGFPFGGSFGPSSTTYQQVYGGSAFGTAAVGITGLSFTLTGGTVNGGTYTLDLSTTAKAVDHLDIGTFANNIGADETQIYSGTLSGQLSGSTLGFTFAPFRYDPAAGNLLLNVSVSGAPATFAGFFLANNGDAGGVYSRAHNFGSGFEGFGLQTTFTVGAAGATVPEPASWLLMIGGFGVVGATLRRRPVLAA